MAARIRNELWIEDQELNEGMKKYVSQRLNREEILDYLERDFSQYAWSFRTLKRRLRAFGIYYTDKRASLEEVQDAVRKELDGPGKLLGYRAMQNRLRQEHDLLVPCDLVHAVMFVLDEEGLAARCPIGKKGKRKGHFTTRGVNWVCSLDGHDKLMSRKLLWLKVWVTNSNPKVVGRWYLEYLYESRVMPSILRLDKGTETVIMTTMHAFLRQSLGDMVPCDTLIYGPSTSNQVISKILNTVFKLVKANTQQHSETTVII